MTDITLDEGLENEPKPNQKGTEPLETLSPAPEQTKEAPTGKETAKRPADQDAKLESEDVIDTAIVAEKEKGEEVDIDDTEEKSKVEEQATPDLSLSDDIKGLLESIDLPEEFKEKATTIFEAAVAGQVADIKKVMEASNTAAMEEYKTSLAAKLEEQTNTYLSNSVAKWLEENQVAVKSNLRTQIAESFMANLVNLLETHHVSVPEGKEDILEAALDKVEKLEKALAEQVEANAAIKLESEIGAKQLALESTILDLTDTQKERVKELAESIKDEPAETYASKLAVIVESITKVVTKPSESLTTDILGEAEVATPEVTPEVIAENIDPEVAFYVKHMQASAVL